MSNLSKHVVATAFLIMFTLNGAMVVDNERIASLLLASLYRASFLGQSSDDSSAASDCCRMHPSPELCFHPCPRKISALLDAPAIKNKPGFLKDVNLFWLNVGRVLNCVVVIEPWPSCLFLHGRRKRGWMQPVSPSRLRKHS